MSQQINLYQAAFRKQPERFSASTLLRASAVVIAAVVLLYAFGRWQLSALRAEVANVEQQHTALLKRLEDTQRKFAARAKNEHLDREIARMETLIAAKSRVRDILERGVFANTRGYSEYLLAFARQHVNGVWLTGFDIAGAGERLTLKGRTTVPELVPQYVQKLANEQTLAGIEFQVFRMERPEKEQRRQPYIEFLATTAGGEKGGKL